MKTVCELNKCTGCKGCIEICPKSALIMLDTIKDLNVVIDEHKCIKCNACKKVCQQINEPILRKPIAWFQGWATENDSRAKSSSGGFAYSLMKKFLQEGGIVCSCKFSNGKLIYKCTRDEEELETFRGSKYVKSDPSGVYETIDEYLKEGQKVLFVGLPCHVSALKNYIGDNTEELLYTVDLVCHGSPSEKLLAKYLMEKEININDLSNIFFRNKNKFRITALYKDNNEVSITPRGVRDKYTIGFLNGLFYTENCYNCIYAGLERVSDITIGDSWGSSLEGTEEGTKGISLALCQTPKGEMLLKQCEIKLLPVDLENAIAANHQLQAPSLKPEQRDIFFGLIKEGVPIDKAIKKCYPKICFRQDIKKSLMRIHLIKS